VAILSALSRGSGSRGLIAIAIMLLTVVGGLNLAGLLTGASHSGGGTTPELPVVPGASEEAAVTTRGATSTGAASGVSATSQSGHSLGAESSSGWTQLETSSSPQARAWGVMTYDAADGYVLLFGGVGTGTFLNDTWSYSDGNWMQIHSPSSPSPRRGAAMAYDPADGYVVLFGGADPNAGFSDTWTFQGGVWSEIFPATSPPARAGASMVYDYSLSELLLCGGTSDYSEEGAGLADTWAFSHGDWTQLSPSTSPPPVNGYGFSYDSDHAKAVLFGGWNPNGGGTSNGTWTFGGSDWEQASTPAGLSARQGPAMSYDSELGQSILFGGQTSDSSYTGDSWYFASGEWVELSSAGGPSGRAYSLICFDVKDDYIILFGGLNSSGVLSGTWVYASQTEGWNGGSVTASIPVGSGPTDLAFDPLNANLYVTNDYGMNLTVVSGVTNTPIGSVPVGVGPRDLAYDPDNGYFYVDPIAGSSTVQVVDPTSSSVVTTLTLGGFPIGLCVDTANGNVYVPSHYSNLVSVINGSTNQLIANVTVGSYVSACAYDPTNGYVYVTDQDSDSISVIDTANNSVVATIGLETNLGPYGIVYDSSNGDLYVGDVGTTANGYAGNSVSVISPALNASVDTILVGSSPGWVAYDPINEAIYVSNKGGGTVSVIDTLVNSVSETLQVGSLPFGLAFDPQNGNVYVTNSGSDNVSVIGVAPTVTYSVTFAESGLPSGTAWSVTLNGSNENSTGPAIVFSEPNGAYAYAVGGVTDYTATPSTGTVPVAGASPATVAIVFTPVYLVTFTESGLQYRMSWSATLDGTTQSSTRTSILFTEPNGSYSYTTGFVSGYDRDPTSGSLAVNGVAVVVTVSFTLVPLTPITEVDLFGGSDYVSPAMLHYSFYLGYFDGYHDSTNTSYPTALIGAAASEFWTRDQSVFLLAPSEPLAPGPPGVNESGHNAGAALFPASAGQLMTISAQGVFSPQLSGDGFEAYFMVTPESTSNWNTQYFATSPEDWPTMTTQCGGSVIFPYSSTPYVVVQWDPHCRGGGCQNPLTPTSGCLGPLGGDFNVYLVGPSCTGPGCISTIPGVGAVGLWLSSPASGDVLNVTATYSRQTNILQAQVIDPNVATVDDGLSLNLSSYGFTPSTVSDVYDGLGGSGNDPTGWGVLSANLTVGGPSLVLPYELTFTETGLPPAIINSAGQPIWGVALENATSRVGYGGGETVRTGISYIVPNGSYFFQLSPGLPFYLPIGTYIGTRYFGTPSSGFVNVNGDSATQDISFTPVSTGSYYVTFSESGLPPDTEWGVTLQGVATYSFATDTISFYVPSGDYQFTVGAVAGYSANPSSGSVVVSGGPVNVPAITFSQTFSTLAVTASATTSTTGAAPLSVSFSAAASGGTPPYTYLWSFDDGQTSDSQNPTHTFAASGSYFVTVTVTDALQSTATSNAVSIVASSVTTSLLAVTAIATTSTSGAPPLEVSFSASASGGTPPYSYLWNFGDTTTNAAQNPTHTFGSVGTYFVYVTVTDASQTTVGSNTITIVVSNTQHSLTVAAQASATSGTAPLTISFTTDVSGGTPPYLYNWVFGDGVTSTLPDPTHVYSNANPYPYIAYVTVTDDLKTTVTSDTISIDVLPAAFQLQVSQTTQTVPLTGLAVFGVTVSSSSASLSVDVSVTNLPVGTSCYGASASDPAVNEGNCPILVGSAGTQTLNEQFSVVIETSASTPLGSPSPQPVIVASSGSPGSTPIDQPVSITVVAVTGVQNQITLDKASLLQTLTSSGYGNCASTIGNTLEECATFQQNLFVDVPGAASEPAYWVQNSVEVGINSAGNWYATGILQAYPTPVSYTNELECLPPAVYPLGSCLTSLASLTPVSFPLTITLSSQIENGQVVMSNPYQACGIGEEYGPSGFGPICTPGYLAAGSYIDFSAYQEGFGPQLVLVGAPAAAGSSTSGNTVFGPGTSGTVQSSLQPMGSTGWIAAAAVAINPSIAAPSRTTGESSSNLYWLTGPASSAFSYTSSASESDWDQGVALVGTVGSGTGKGESAPAPQVADEGAAQCSDSCSETLTASDPGSVAPGDILVAALTTTGETAPPLTATDVTDTYGATWTLLGSPLSWDGAATDLTYIFYSSPVNRDGAGSVTIDFGSDTPAGASFAWIAVAGVNPANPVDVYTSNTAGSPGFLPSATVTTTSDNDLLVGFVGDGIAAVPTTSTVGFAGADYTSATVDTYLESASVGTAGPYTSSPGLSAYVDYAIWLLALQPYVISPTLTLSSGGGTLPTSGLTAGGTGFAPYSNVTFTIDVGTISQVPDSCQTNEYGSFSGCGLRIDSAPAGIRTLTAADASSNFATATFTVTPETYAVTFTETGLPTTTLAKYGWTVELNGTVEHSTTATISFWLPNGTYAALITGPSGYWMTGGVRLAYGGAQSVTVSGITTLSPVFKAGATYTLAFSEAGLPTGQSWCVEVDAYQQCTAKSSMGYLNLTPGSYAYAIVSPLAGQEITAKLGKTVLPLSGVLTVTKSETVGLTFVYPYAVTFTESGLVSGTRWCVTIGKSTECTIGVSIVFDLKNGTYAYKIAVGSGYSVTPMSGRVVVNGAAMPVGLVAYTVTFTESGLLSGTRWCVKLGKTTECSTGTSIVFAEGNGTYAYVIGVAAGSSVSPTSGREVVDGASTSVSINSYAVTFTESGLTSGTNWCVKIGSTNRCSTTTTVVFYLGNGTYAYRIGAIRGYTVGANPAKAQVAGGSASVTVTFKSKSGHASGVGAVPLLLGVPLFAPAIKRPRRRSPSRRASGESSTIRTAAGEKRVPGPGPSSAATGAARPKPRYDFGAVTAKAVQHAQTKTQFDRRPGPPQIRTALKPLSKSNSAALRRPVRQTVARLPTMRGASRPWKGGQNHRCRQPEGRVPRVPDPLRPRIW